MKVKMNKTKNESENESDNENENKSRNVNENKKINLAIWTTTRRFIPTLLTNLRP